MKQKSSVFIYVSLVMFLITAYRIRVLEPSVPIASRTKLRQYSSFEIAHWRVTGTGPVARPVELLSGSGSQNEFRVAYLPVLPWGLDVNRADASLLTLIRGVGPAKALKILQDRRCNGPFRDMSDFQRRAGIKLNESVLASQWIYAGE